MADTTTAITVSPRRTRHHRAQRRRDEHPVRGIARAGRCPVPDGRVEPDVVTEARLGIGEDPRVQIRLAHRQTLKDEGQHQHSGTRDGPGDDRPEHARLGTEPPRQQEDPGPDHRTDHHRGQCRQADLVACLFGLWFGRGHGSLRLPDSMSRTRPTAINGTIASLSDGGRTACVCGDSVITTRLTAKHGPTSHDASSVVRWEYYKSEMIC